MKLHLIALLSCLFFSECRTAPHTGEQHVQFRLPAVPYAVDSSALTDMQFVYPPIDGPAIPVLDKN